MAYFLEAFVFRTGDIDASDVPAKAVRIVPLTERLSLLPLTDELLTSAKAGPGEGPSDASESPLPPRLDLWARRVSHRGPIAYIVAEFFGGTGNQYSIVWSGGEIVLGPLRALDAINQALRLLGVEGARDKDEFDLVGLGRHRHTDQWIPVTT